VVDKISFLKPNNLYRSIFPGYDIVVPQKNIGGYISKLKKIFPREIRNIQAIFNHMHRIFNEVKAINISKELKKSPNLIMETKISLADMLGYYSDNVKLKAIIAQYWMYCGLPLANFLPFIFHI